MACRPTPWPRSSSKGDWRVRDVLFGFAPTRPDGAGASVKDLVEQPGTPRREPRARRVVPAREGPHGPRPRASPSGRPRLAVRPAGGRAPRGRSHPALGCGSPPGSLPPTPGPAAGGSSLRERPRGRPRSSTAPAITTCSCGAHEASAGVSGVPATLPDASGDRSRALLPRAAPVQPAAGRGGCDPDARAAARALPRDGLGGEARYLLARAHAAANHCAAAAALYRRVIDGDGGGREDATERLRRLACA